MIETDDDLYRVDQHWLGPPGRAFPRPIRWQAVGIGALLFLLSLILVMGVLSLPWSGWSVTVALGLTYLGTNRIVDGLGHERTIRSLARSAINDLTSPRPVAGRNKKTQNAPQSVSIPDQIARVRLTPADADHTTSYDYEQVGHELSR
ncbi:hypothetical protein [Rhodococcus jostii]|uniref:Transmembrane protein n=1 Tax=Rhodococcus jostii TaxID=132919 RepID=A0A1H4JHS8_RHOJO|nr:hypothetical protein [Rhodococcus jostii]SEB45605.1 hypothetical protein SAMN04490220_0899 [Rhodococcus jostii]